MSVAEVETEKQNMYEGMFLLNSTKFANDPEGSTEGLMSILEKAGASVVAHRPWQDGKLAYEIEGQRKGLHYLVCFKMAGAGTSILNRQCQLSDLVVRHMVIKHRVELFDAMVGALTVSEEEPEAEVAEGGEGTAEATDA
ncbi:MAG: 30S ribosomal protein S6 [Fuerstiella sp.]